MHRQGTPSWGLTQTASEIEHAANLSYSMAEPLHALCDFETLIWKKTNLNYAVKSGSKEWTRIQLPLGQLWSLPMEKQRPPSGPFTGGLSSSLLQSSLDTTMGKSGWWPISSSKRSKLLLISMLKRAKILEISLCQAE